MKKLEEKAKFGRSIVVSCVVSRNLRDPEISPYRIKPTYFGYYEQARRISPGPFHLHQAKVQQKC